MSLCRACLVLMSTQDTAYDLYSEKDLATKFFDCTGANNYIEALKGPLDDGINLDAVLSCICECCYKMVQKIHDFQRMCKESLRNLEKLLSEVNSKDIGGAENESTTIRGLIEEVEKVHEAVVPKEPMPIEDIEEVYIIEDDAARESLGQEKLTISSRSRLRFFKRLPGHRDKLKCNICSRGFYKSSLLEAHMKNHVGEEPYKCVHCDKNYSRGDLLDTHLRQVHQIQSESSIFSCSYPNCKKVYSALRSLNYHKRRKHIKEEESKISKHICEKCGKTFGRRAHLTRHQWVHSIQSENRFACTACPRRFYTNQNLQDHLLRLHSDSQLWRCKSCGRIFKYRALLSAHMKKHVGQ